MTGRELLRLDRLTKAYGDGRVVVRDLDLQVAEGEFLSLLGPSGCGKTTTLRLVAGLEQPDAGHIVLRGRDITREPAHRRPVNTVFQDYALFPHLSVRRNVGFGLAMQRAPSATIARRVADMLAVVGLSDHAEARPQRLSGGQKQRAALARALVREPELLLLDEPLSALDTQLRGQMQDELKSLQGRLGITFVLVTHDQSEALSLSDRIALMQDGRVVQVGTPAALYDRPSSVFAARFLGPANLLPATRLDAHTVRLAAAGVVLRASRAAEAVPATGPCQLLVRPEDVRLAGPAAAGDDIVTARIERLLFAGAQHRLHAMLQDGTPIAADLAREQSQALVPGDVVRLQLPATRATMLPIES